ncbi:MAG: hypothetical protein K2X38_08900 [Gemmataceae bacterium]|nr:hypothetical protein [Gemmataceae bacterium]
MTMNPIEYRDFWDVPRMFIVRYRGLSFLFDCAFNETEEDYGDSYRVMLLPELTESALQGSWADFSKRAMRDLGTVAIRDIVFDPSRRQAIDSGFLDRLLLSSLPQTDPLLADVSIPT